MGFIVSVILIMPAVLSNLITKKIFSPITIFNTVFSAVCFCSMFNLQDGHVVLYTGVEFSVYLIVLTGVLFFDLGTLIKLPVKNKKDAMINMKLYYIFLVLAIIGMLIAAGTSIIYLMQGNSIKNIYRMTLSAAFVENDFSLTAAQSRFLTFIGNPMYYLMVPVLLLQYFREKKKLYLLFVLFLVSMKVLSHFGRVEFMYVFLYVIVLMSDKTNNQCRKRPSVLNIKNVLLITVMIAGLVGVFAVRDTKIVSTIIEYIGKPLLYLQYLLEDTLKEYGYTYGFFSTLGIGQFVFGIIELFGIAPPELFEIAQTHQLTVASAHTLADGTLYNAFSTLFYYFFTDFGWIGIAVFSFIYGCIANRFFANVKNKRSDRDTVIWLLLLMTMTFSFVRWQLSRSEMAMSVVYAYLLFSGKSKVHHS